MSRQAGKQTALPWNPYGSTTTTQCYPLPALLLVLPKALLPKADHSARHPSHLQATLSSNQEARVPKGFYRHSGHPDCHLPRVGTMSSWSGLPPPVLHAGGKKAL